MPILCLNFIAILHLDVDGCRYTKNFAQADVAPAFSFALLHALLECLPLVGSAHSAGALHWYFTLLNRVKCMDITATGQRCAEMLVQVGKHYSQRANPLHALLKTR